MSKIDELIERLCPDGVEYKALSEVCGLTRGVRVVKKNLSNDGEIPVFQNALRPLGYHSAANRRAGMTFVICAGAAGQIGYSPCAFWAADDCYTIESSFLSDRFLYHLLLSKQPRLISQVRKASIPRLSRVAIENLSIPVPPMEVQEEIVRVLDSFTELEARKAQYAFYRDNLINETLHTSDKVKLKNLGVFTGSTPKKSNRSYFGCDYPFYKPGDFDCGKEVSETADKLSEKGLLASKTVPEGSSLVVCIGASIGKVGFASLKGACNQQINVIPPHQDYDPRFIFHCTNSRYFQDQIKRLGNYSSMPILNLKAFSEIEIPIPSMSKQVEVAANLDQFDALINDISQGLPAEIEARRKQYVYYRDKLLSFKERVH